MFSKLIRRIGSFEISRVWPFLLAALIIAYQIFAPPVVAVANNGDFSKVIARFSLGSPFEDEHRFTHVRLTFDSHYHWNPGFFSSETMLFVIALGVNTVLSKKGDFDIRYMGALHAALLLATFYLALPLFNCMDRRYRPIFSTLAVLVFTDVFYVSGLNSFYMDTASTLFLLLAIVFYLRAARWREGRDRLGLAIACLLFATAKTQHILTAGLIAVLVIWKARALGGGTRFRLMMAAAMLAAFGIAGVTSPPSYSASNIFDVVFWSILPHSGNVPADLAALGLDDSYRRFTGIHSFSEGSPMADLNFVAAFHARTSYIRLLKFYKRHPDVAYRLIIEGLDAGGRPRPILGNFDPSEGLPPHAESRAFSMWSSAKGSLFAERGGVYLYFTIGALLIVCGAALWNRRKYPAGIAEGLCFLSAAVVVEMLVASLAAVLDPTRHFYFFNVTLDCVLVCGAAVGILCFSIDFGIDAPQRPRNLLN